MSETPRIWGIRPNIFGAGPARHAAEIHVYIGTEPHRTREAAVSDLAEWMGKLADSGDSSVLADIRDMHAELERLRKLRDDLVAMTERWDKTIDQRDSSLRFDDPQQHYGDGSRDRLVTCAAELESLLAGTKPEASES